LKNCQHSSNSTSKTAIATQQKQQHYGNQRVLCFASKIYAAKATAQQ